MLVDGRGLPRNAGNDDPGVLVFGNGLSLEERGRLVENAGVAELANIAREHIGQPQMRVARLGALAEARAAVRGAVPPFEHVALAKLLAGVQHDLRAGEARFEQDQRQHVLQLIAIAGRAAALVRSHPAPEPGSVELIGQPCVDEAIEVGPVRAHLDFAEPIRPRGSGCGEIRLGLGDGRPGRSRQRFCAARRLAEHDRRFASLLPAQASALPQNAATRRPSSLAAPSAEPVSTIAGVWMSRPGPPKNRVLTVSVVGFAMLVAAKAKPRSKSLRGF